MEVYTENEVLNSLFTPGGTLANEGIEIKNHRKNAKDIYFSYNGREFCINKHNVILKFSDHTNGRYFQYAVLDFNDGEYDKVLAALKEKLGRV